MFKIDVKGGKKYHDSVKKEAGEFASLMSRQLKIDNDFSINIQLHSSRKSFNKTIGRDTKEWEVGNTNQNNEIDILDPDAFEKDSCHPRSHFSSILNHELAHIFIKIASSNKVIPLWLNEGLAMHFAGQVDQYTSDGLFVENEFLRKISTQHGWNTYADSDAYRFSCLFVEYLVTKYSIEKLIKLLKSLDSVYYQESFENKFKKIFGVELLKAEKDFAKN